jgi:hypothetical protein
MSRGILQQHWICTSVNCIRDAWPGQQGLKACANNLPAAGEISACHLSLTYREKSDHKPLAIVVKIPAHVR